MASTAQNDINKFTLDNGSITDLRELMFLQILKYGSVAETLTMQFGVRNGKKIGGIGEFDIIGQTANMCEPEWNHTKLNTVEDEWRLGVLDIAEDLCADDFEETIAQYALNTGTRRADMTDTEILNVIIEPRLTEAINKAVWRYLWFNDISAKNIADGGVITDGINLKYFTGMDGLFKRLFDLTSGVGNTQHVEITANSEASYADQFDAMFDQGAALEVFKNLIYKANIKIRQSSDKAVWCTQSFADALAEDIKGSNKGSDLQWNSLFDGLISATKYNGHTIYAIPIWDEMIAAYENDGTALNKPHRALYASKSSLWGGCESAGTFIPDLDIWFSKDHQKNKIKGREKFGTVIWQPELIQFAY